MRIVVGIFTMLADAQATAADLVGAGIARRRVAILTPEPPRRARARGRNDPPERPRRQGAGDGRGCGRDWPAAADLAPPGVPVLPIAPPAPGLGIAAVVLLGAAGTASGAGAGGTLAGLLSSGVSGDDVLRYAQALRRGRSVIVVEARDGDEHARVRSLLVEGGAEDLDGAATDVLRYGYLHGQAHGRRVVPPRPRRGRSAVADTPR